MDEDTRFDDVSAAINVAIHFSRPSHWEKRGWIFMGWKRGAPTVELLILRIYSFAFQFSKKCNLIVIT